MKLWAGQTVSMFGSGITALALPLTAVGLLEATPAQMGLLTALGALPALALGLVAGARVDRRPRRPVLIAADLGRAALLALVPILAALERLRMAHLYVLALPLSTLELFFDVAYRAFLPTLVGREQLVEGNSKLQMSRSAAEIAAPGLAGGLVELITAPSAILLDALSFLVSGLFLGWIKGQEAAPRAAEQRESLGREIKEGLSLVVGNRTLRAIAGCEGTLSLFNSALETVFILYVTRGLGIEAGALGLIFSAGSVGFLVGALASGRASQRLGLGWAIIGGVLLAAVSDLLVPLAGGATIVVAVILIASQFCFGLGLTMYNIGQVSLRQAVTPDALQGRMNGTMYVIGMGSVPLGGLLGGALGEMIGLRGTLVVAAVGEIMAAAWLVRSPLRRLREQPVVAG